MLAGFDNAEASALQRLGESVEAEGKHMGDLKGVVRIQVGYLNQQQPIIDQESLAQHLQVRDRTRDMFKDMRQADQLEWLWL